MDVPQRSETRDTTEIERLEVKLRAQAKTFVPLDRRTIREEILQRFLLVYGHSQGVQKLETFQHLEGTCVAPVVSVWPLPSVNGGFSNQPSVALVDHQIPHVEVVRRRRKESVLAREDFRSFFLCFFA